ncbi:MAG TPA: bifunctional pyr operon transcriptional regulator/uracil phosphoribosyltransferase, partial [Myxococcota bacterium]
MIARLAHEIVDRTAADAKGPLRLDASTLALVGVRTGGAHVAVRLQKAIEKLVAAPVPVGLL